MDVIGPDDHPTETSGKLPNGNASLPDDDTATAVATAVSGGTAAGKRKKRKNKAKNSLPEMASSTDGGVAAATIDTQSSPSAKGTKGTAAVAEATPCTVNSSYSSNSNSSHTSNQCNGLPDASQPSIEAISKKLEQCVQIGGRNGMTNGLPKHAAMAGPLASPPGSSVVETLEPSQTTTTGKKKHRSRQSKKAQHDTTTTTTSCCLSVVNGEHVEEDQHKEQRQQQQHSMPKSTAFPGVESDAVKKSVPAPPTEPSVTATVQPEQLPPTVTPVEITYQVYESERQMPAIMALIQKDLSEPYSIYTYRYFIHNWPKLCFLALHRDTCVGAIVCKLDIHRQETRRGYIAMLAVDKDYRKLKIGTTLVQNAIQVMLEDNADEVVLETEITNQPALRLYENLGFVRDKRLFHYYLNGVDALRLKLWFR